VQQRVRGQMLAGPISLHLVFYFVRPRTHFKTGKKTWNVLREDAPLFYTSAPDVDKLARAVLDALSGILFIDDRQVAVLEARKLYARTPGLWISWGQAVDVGHGPIERRNAAWSA
jgi:Holliday junction resolvase RusA-like endonuclease